MSTIAPSASARERLLAAALECFARDGALSVTLEELRAEAGVSVGALYHHFRDRRALATALYVDVLSGYQEAALEELRRHAGAREGVEGLVALHLRWCARNRDGARFLFTQRGLVDDAVVTEASGPFLREVMAWYRGHAHYGAVRELPAEVVYAMWIGPAQEWARHWLAGRTKAVPRAVTGELAGAAWRSLEA